MPSPVLATGGRTWEQFLTASLGADQPSAP
jgi:hypothetical protein